MCVTDKRLITRGIAAPCRLHHVTHLNPAPPYRNAMPLPAELLFTELASSKGARSH